MRATSIVGGLLVLALAMAGCTGSFDIEQTEPIQVQVNGQPQEARVAADGSGETGESDTQEFKIVTPDDVEVVKVIVECEKVEGGEGNATMSPTANATGNASGSPAVIMIIVEDRDSGETLDEERVEIQGDSAQASLEINVKGKDNVVVVTQAVQGVADVNVAAQGAQTNASPAPTGNATYAP